MSLTTAISVRSHTLNFANPETFFNLNSDLINSILSCLQRSELLNLCLVCKKWKEFAESTTLWSREAAVLNITGGQAIKVKIIQLLALARISDALLDKKVKTARELDSMMLPLMFDRSFPQNQAQELIQEYSTELNEKFALHDKIEQGLEATILLSSLGLRGADKLKHYASCLLDKYGDDKGWLTVAAGYTEEKNFSEALAIVNGPLADNYDKASIINKIVYSQAQSDIDLAMETMKLYMEDKCFIESAYFSDCQNSILLYAKDAKNLQAVEKAIDTIVGEDWKDIEIINLANAYLDRNDYTQAHRVYEKYEKTITVVKGKYKYHQLIELYVRLGFYEKAWKLAEARKVDDNLIFYVLRNAFADIDLEDETKKAQKIIDESKTENT